MSTLDVALKGSYIEKKLHKPSQLALWWFVSNLFGNEQM